MYIMYFASPERGRTSPFGFSAVDSHPKLFSWEYVRSEYVASQHCQCTELCGKYKNCCPGCPDPSTETASLEAGEGPWFPVQCSMGTGVTSIYTCVLYIYIYVCVSLPGHEVGGMFCGQVVV